MPLAMYSHFSPRPAPQWVLEDSSPQSTTLGSSPGPFVPFLVAHVTAVDLPDFFTAKCLLSLCDY